MDCIGCPISVVCKSYEALKAISIHAKVSLTNCEMKNMVSKTNTIQASTAVPTETYVAEQHELPKVMRNFNKESREAAEKAAAEKVVGPSIGVVITPEEEVKSILVECPTCNGRTYDDDLIVCEKCKTIITCSNCSTVPVDGKYKGKRLCDPCYADE